MPLSFINCTIAILTYLQIRLNTSESFLVKTNKPDRNTHTFFISNWFISNQPSEVKVLSNFKSSVIFEEATITRKNEHNWNPVKYLNVLHHSRTQNYIVKILLTSYFGYFGHVWSTPSTTIMPTCRNFDVNLHVKISTLSLTFS